MDIPVYKYIPICIPLSRYSHMCRHTLPTALPPSCHSTSYDARMDYCNSLFRDHSKVCPSPLLPLLIAHLPRRSLHISSRMHEHLHWPPLLASSELLRSSSSTDPSPTFALNASLSSQNNHHSSAISQTL